MNLIEIKEYKNEMYELYDIFLKKNKSSMFYHTIKYRNFLLELIGASSKYLILLDNGVIQGALPLMYKDGKYGRVYNSLPFYGSHGGIVANNKNYFDLLLKEYIKIISDTDTGSSVLIETPHNDIDYLAAIKVDLVDQRIGQWTSMDYIDNIEENIMNSFDSSARRNVRKAIKSNVQIKIDNTQIEFLYETHYDNIISIGGKAKDKIFFELIEKYFEKEKDYNIYIAKLNEKKIGALLLFYYNKTVEYFTPAALSEYRSYQPTSLIIYQAMIDASKKGYKWWNWGGTWLTQDGVYKFKKKFGAVDKEYKYFIKINNQDICNSCKEELLKEYDNFYVIPFEKLKGVK